MKHEIITLVFIVVSVGAYSQGWPVLEQDGQHCSWGTPGEDRQSGFYHYHRGVDIQNECGGQMTTAIYAIESG